MTVRFDQGWSTSAAAVLFSSCALVLTYLAGCAESQLRTTPLTPSRTPFVKDIPVPMHFELVDQLSEDYSAPGWRLIRHTYFGEASPYTLRQFYQENMPKAGWRLISDRHIHGKFNLLFQKGSEFCEIEIRPESRNFTRGAAATVIVKPVGTVTRKRAE